MCGPLFKYARASAKSIVGRTVPLKREEIHASAYRDFERLNQGIEEFTERYYNRIRLHSALGYCSPEQNRFNWTPVILQRDSGSLKEEMWDCPFLARPLWCLFADHPRGIHSALQALCLPGRCSPHPSI
jgi:hypothetical protein